MSTANNPTRETTIRLSQQSLGDIGQVLEAALDRQLERFCKSSQAFNVSLDKTLEKADGLDKKLDKLANVIDDFTVAPNTTFEREAR